MDIAWLGHSCFRLSSADMVVVTDPYPAGLGLRPDVRPASVVTVSNTHPNHSNWQGVAGEPKVFRSPGEYEYNGIAVRGVMTPLAPGRPQEQRNVAYSIEIDGVNICHLGDIDAPLATRQVDDLKPVDVLLVPAGGRCTLGVDQVHQTVQDLDPRIVVPMHHAHERVNVPLDPADAFLRRMGLDAVQPQARLQITPSSTPADVRLVLLTVQRRAT